MPLTARLAAVLPTEMGKDMKQSDKSLTTRQQRTQEGAPVIIRAGSGRGVLSSAHSSNFAVRGDEYSLQKIRYKIRSFRDAFGIFGVPKLLIMLSCIVWTTWLIVAALAPNHTANWLMGTGDYDNGQFWVVRDKNPNITIAGAAGLACVDAAYIYVFIKTLRWRERVDTIASFIQLQPLGIKDPSTEVIKTSYMRALADLNRRWSRFYKDLTAFTGINRKFWVTFHLECIINGLCAYSF
ncbi:unnamed protein product [Phytophthora lilii]|uniref:Unnamed protein product n=1 Tax=Phytophthora lilii TaxID=2077276 RepID=A0A9W6TFJ4_9STRA|nr:unnamed protein product [Phytophthora lilii]